MAEYIEREAALNFEVDSVLLVPSALQPFMDGMAFYAEHIKRLPAADVVPVVHGRWSVQEIYKHEMSYGTTAYEPVYKCSACGNLMESYLRYDEPIMPEDADFPRYCPNCGAKMGGDGE